MVFWISCVYSLSVRASASARRYQRLRMFDRLEDIKEYACLLGVAASNVFPGTKYQQECDGAGHKRGLRSSSKKKENTRKYKKIQEK